MIIFSKQKFVITLGILTILFYTSFIANSSYIITYKLSSIRDIYTSISNFLTLEQTPDQIYRNSKNAILNNNE